MPPGRQYYLLLITVVRVYRSTQRCQKKLKMKKQGFFCQICVIGGISIEGARAPLGHSPGFAYDFEIRLRP